MPNFDKYHKLLCQDFSIRVSNWVGLFCYLTIGLVLLCLLANEEKNKDNAF